MQPSYGPIKYNEVVLLDKKSKEDKETMEAYEKLLAENEKNYRAIVEGDELHKDLILEQRVQNDPEISPGSHVKKQLKIVEELKQEYEEENE